MTEKTRRESRFRLSSGFFIEIYFKRHIHMHTIQILQLFHGINRLKLLLHYAMTESNRESIVYAKHLSSRRNWG